MHPVTRTLRSARRRMRLRITSRPSRTAAGFRQAPRSRAHTCRSNPTHCWLRIVRRRPRCSNGRLRTGLSGTPMRRSIRCPAPLAECTRCPAVQSAGQTTRNTNAPRRLRHRARDTRWRRIKMDGRIEYSCCRPLQARSASAPAWPGERPHADSVVQRAMIAEHHGCSTPLFPRTLGRWHRSIPCSVGRFCAGCPCPRLLQAAR
jgi:hypothetical protein